MKVAIWVVFMEDWNCMPYCMMVPVSFYKQEETANNECDLLNSNNKDPLDGDSYGPYRGTQYLVEKRELI